MPPKNTGAIKALCSIPSLFLSLALVTILLSSLFFLRPSTPPPPLHSSSSASSSSSPSPFADRIRVHVAELPRSLNYGLLDTYWSSPHADSRVPADPDRRSGPTHPRGPGGYPPYPENPLIEQYSAEYWILGDLETPRESRGGSFAERVGRWEEADVVFVPFFATLSAEMQLGRDKGRFRKKEGNEDYGRQREVVDLVRSSEAWRRSGEGITCSFSLTQLQCGMLDSKSSDGSTSDMVHHTQVSLLKDVIVPYTHLLPRLHLSENQKRQILLYFKGAKHRHRGGIVREKLWDLLVEVPGVIMEEGFPNATGREKSIRGMRTSEFCLHPAGDTPTSCRLFDAIQSLCIPVIVSDNIELPFEGILDYSDFSVFVATTDALRPNWLVNHLRSFSEEQKDKFRRNMAKVQSNFEYNSGHPGGIGPIPPDGAVNYIWRKVHQKLPRIKEAIIRERRKPPGVSIPLRCHCT
ncbi:hypothetical protein NL676_028020 [Syzygium grande]|nr:hypothetical protein NL676_028020 [Syzygium grande]